MKCMGFSTAKEQTIRSGKHNNYEKEATKSTRYRDQASKASNSSFSYYSYNSGIPRANVLVKLGPRMSRL